MRYKIKARWHCVNKLIIYLLSHGNAVELAYKIFKPLG